LAAIPLLAGAAALAFFLLREPEGVPIEARAAAPSAEAATPIAEDEAELTVLCVPYCSDVELEGRPLGPSPVIRRAVAPGRKTLVMRRPGTPDKSMAILLSAGEREEVSVSMAP